MSHEMIFFFWFLYFFYGGNGGSRCRLGPDSVDGRRGDGEGILHAAHGMGVVRGIAGALALVCALLDLAGGVGALEVWGLEFFDAPLVGK